MATSGKLSKEPPQEGSEERSEKELNLLRKKLYKRNTLQNDETCLFYLFSALLIIFISSCSSTRSMKKGVSIGNLSESEYMEELISRSPGWDAITAKMSLAVDLNGKGPTKVNGTLRMKRDEVIQLSIAPFWVLKWHVLKYLRTEF